MEPQTAWRFVAVGFVLVSMALGTTVLKRLPLTTSMLYLACGCVFGAHGFGLFHVDLARHASAIEHVTEAAVLISLFTVGLKLRLPLHDRRWWIALRLASLSMVVTVALIALVAYFAIGLPLGAAILLGAMLSPTDPVLASDVQVTHPDDDDRVRFGLTAEAGLNDGTAFPFALLGLGLLHLHNLGPWGLTWLGVDVVWSSVGGLALGAALGTLVGTLVVFLRREHKEALGLDDFLALGLVATSYGSALLLHASGFLAVFAAGMAVRRIERTASHERGAAAIEPAAPMSHEDATIEVATGTETASAYLAHAVLLFNEQVERIGEVAVVIVLGGLLSWSMLTAEAMLFALLLFLVIRPISVVAGLAGVGVTRMQTRLFAWFGVRGIGSIYYLAYATAHGLDPALAGRLAAIVLCVVAASVVVHGVSVTPIMQWYSQRRARRAEKLRPMGVHKNDAATS